MFTGIIEAIGIVRGIEKKQNYKLIVESLIFKDQKVGQSIAVNGVCLTLSALKNNLATFDVIAETLKKSNLGLLKIYERVNLERALKIGDRLSGHFVTGHIDCVGKIIEKNKQPDNYCIKVGISKNDMRFIVPRGSIALDGISLTVAAIGPDNFTVYLIPHTVENTDLKSRGTNDPLNIEFDLLGKYVERGRLSLRSYLESGEPSPITEDFLRKHGY